ncbi:putative Islet cell autoantigen 1-like protein [Hypsibius exemplaris]|uniref:Islet cell autoantigen 1-like protein n=1 Tax=Hypsibius exemplaris TaxID=2072580 RepID=A0A1W0WDZ9_HYPEX|nr:putative Islet cell autoantigen 1-like protein [Hypsibius exemplaris]
MSDWDTQRGYSGAAFDQHVGRTEQSPFQKVKEQFWTAKQVVLQKLGKKEDDHLVASDAELDAKLELFNSIKFSSGSLMRIANRYQKVMHEISKEEYAMGQFLKRHGEQDPSRAGAMLQNTAKAFVISAQKRYGRLQVIITK